jgi:hypothetical protein
MRRLLLSLCLLCGVAALEPTPATTTAPPTYTPTLVTDAPSVRSHFWCDPAPGLADIQVRSNPTLPTSPGLRAVGVAAADGVHPPPTANPRPQRTPAITSRRSLSTTHARRLVAQASPQPGCRESTHTRSVALLWCTTLPTPRPYISTFSRPIPQRTQLRAVSADPNSCRRRTGRRRVWACSCTRVTRWLWRLSEMR